LAGGLTIGDLVDWQILPKCVAETWQISWRSALLAADFFGILGGALLARGGVMNPQADALKRRAHEFFVRVIALCQDLPKTAAANSIASQLADSAGSAASNYRAACKGRSRKEFIAKIGIAAEEADESLGWLEALRDAKLGNADEVIRLIQEADELASIFVASHKTAESRLAEEEKLRALQKQVRRRRT
jgi:four helix bundle protein